MSVNFNIPYIRFALSIGPARCGECMTRKDEIFFLTLGNTVVYICRSCMECLEGRSRMARKGDFDYTRKRGEEGVDSEGG